MYLYLFLDNLLLCPTASHCAPAHTIIAHHPLHVLHTIPSHTASHIPRHLLSPSNNVVLTAVVITAVKKYTLSKGLPACRSRKKNPRVAGFRALFLLYSIYCVQVRRHVRCGVPRRWARSLAIRDCWLSIEGTTLRCASASSLEARPSHAVGAAPRPGGFYGRPSGAGGARVGSPPSAVVK